MRSSKNQGFWGSLFSFHSGIVVVYLLIAGAVFAGVMLGGHHWIFYDYARPPFRLFLLAAGSGATVFFGLSWVHNKIVKGVQDRHNDNKSE